MQRRDAASLTEGGAGSDRPNMSRNERQHFVESTKSALQSEEGVENSHLPLGARTEAHEGQVSTHADTRHH